MRNFLTTISLFLVTIGLTTLLNANFLSAAQLGTLNPNEAAAMKEYKPDFIYKGQYWRTTLYLRNPGSPYWRKISKAKEYSDVVKCAPAIKSLQSTGLWQGHLGSDGSCGSASEPSYFALGNRLNFDELKSEE